MNWVPCYEKTLTKFPEVLTVQQERIQVIVLDNTDELKQAQTIFQKLTLFFFIPIANIGKELNICET